MPSCSLLWFVVIYNKQTTLSLLAFSRPFLPFIINKKSNKFGKWENRPFLPFRINKQTTLSLLAVSRGFSPFIINKQRNKFEIMRKIVLSRVYNKQTNNFVPSCCLSWFLTVYNKQTKKIIRNNEKNLPSPVYNKQTKNFVLPVITSLQLIN